MTKRRVGILIFNDVELLDFAGPFQVFSRRRLVAGAGIADRFGLYRGRNVGCSASSAALLVAAYESRCKERK